jgi:ABC-type glycerol-3-phosphate transport system permease component
VIAADRPAVDRRARGRRTRRQRERARLGLDHLLAIGASLLFVYPLVWLLSASLKPAWQIYRQPLALVPDGATLEVYERIFLSTPFPTYLVNSLIYATVGTLLTVAVAMLAAYGLSRHEFRGKNLAMVAILTVQLMPALISAIPVYILMQRLNLFDTQMGIVLLYGAVSIPFGVWVLKGYLDTIPRELDESAWIDGASKLYTLWRILVPVIVPGLASLFIILFVGKWNEFAMASILLRDTSLFPLTVGTQTLLGPDESDFRLTAAASLINIVPILLVFLGLQRYLISGLTAGAVKQ